MSSFLSFVLCFILFSVLCCFFRCLECADLSALSRQLIGGKSYVFKIENYVDDDFATDILLQVRGNENQRKTQKEQIVTHQERGNANKQTKIIVCFNF